MSALEQSDFYADRRRAERLQPAHVIAVGIGRGCGTMVDVSRGGVRVHHTVATLRASRVRVTFDWDKERFAATAEVLASRVASVGEGGGTGTIYESRLRFVNMTGEALELLDRVLASLSDGNLRRWISNLRGWGDEPARRAQTPGARLVLRCRLIDGGWRKLAARDRSQPADGFAVPASATARDVAALCDTYERADDDGRHLLRLMCAAVVEDSVPGIAA